jgi:ABC-type sugar transport system ATPase subunit
MLELNDVLLSGAKSTLSLMACDGELTCLTRLGAPLGSTAVRWLHAMMGLEPTTGGFISIDGEPLTASSARSMRRLMAFVPAELGDVGQVVVFSAPTADDVFRLKANRNGKPEQMEQEMALTGATGQKAQLLAVASLLRRPIWLVDRPVASSIPFLRRKADEGCTVVIASNDNAVVSKADNVVEIE